MAAKNDTTAGNLDANAPEGVALKPAEEIAARKEGAKEDVKEAAKAAHHSLTDGSLPGEPVIDPYMGSDESQQYAYMLEDGVDQFDTRINGKDSQVTPTMAAGLLKLERAGQNRTPFVQTLLKKLDVKGKDIATVTDAGPSYTNDLTSITVLK